MDIPYTVEERSDTGLFNAKLGIWLFLASEVMLFGGLFSAYIFLRFGAPDGAFHEWGKELNIPLATLNTLILISSSVTMVMSWASLKLQDIKKYKLYMGLTLLCALGFLVIKYLEYTAKFDHHIFPSTNTFFAIYFYSYGSPWITHYWWYDRSFLFMDPRTKNVGISTCPIYKPY